jgi:hypothetical protein
MSSRLLSLMLTKVARVSGVALVTILFTVGLMSKKLVKKVKVRLLQV